MKANLRDIFTIFLQPFHRAQREAPPVFSDIPFAERSERRNPHSYAASGTTGQTSRRRHAAAKRRRKISKASRRANR